MYSLLGIEKNIESLLVLASLDGQFPKTTEELKLLYKKYLKSIQSVNTVSRLSNGTELVWDSCEAKDLIELFGVQSKLNDMNQDKVISKTILANSSAVEIKTKQALETFKSLEPQYFYLFQLVIEKIFFAGSELAGGGSSSAALGCIWLNPRAYWTEQDYLEFFVHELTHNLVFLDERREIHYSQYAELEKTENFAYSAILKRARPLDKVVHSLFVVNEVLNFRLKHFVGNEKTYLHPDTENLFNGAFDTLKSLKKIRRELMTKHLKDLIEKIERNLIRMKGSYNENQKFINY